MISKEQLAGMERMSRVAEPDALVDLLDVKIKGDSPAQRLSNYLKQVKNPYRFKVGDTLVSISYQTGENTLEEKIKSYFISRKS